MDTPRKIKPRKINNRDVGLSHPSRESAPPSRAPKNGGEMGGHALGAATRFQPGHPGGPGRPPGIKEMIRQKTRDGRDIVEFLVKAMNDELYPKRRLRPADRLEATRILCERRAGAGPA